MRAVVWLAMLHDWLVGFAMVAVSALTGGMVALVLRHSPWPIQFLLSCVATMAVYLSLEEVRPRPGELLFIFKGGR